MRLGVLIIGSLYWDNSTIREEWRCERLEMDAAKHVEVPIRYGRLSSSRGCTYTMVFSMNLVRQNQFGRAIVVPYKRPVNSIKNLIEEAKRLWAAESKKEKSTRISARNGWGHVALLENPDRCIPSDLRQGWTERVSRESCYGQLMNSAVGEEVVVDKSGFLKIPWPKSEDGIDLGLDALLATATNPTICRGLYPSAQQIAAAWNTTDGKKSVDYFCKNRAHGIKTFQDIEIEDRLSKLWQ